MLPTRKAEALLAYLAVRPGQAHSRETLATLLWADMGDVQARSNLRHTVFLLRRALQPARPDALSIEHRLVALEPSAVEVDVVAFEHHVATGTTEALSEAARLYRGDFLQGFTLAEVSFEEWLTAERERLRELALGALGKLLTDQMKSQGTEPAIQTALRLLALDPLGEEAHCALMRLYARQNRYALALRQYQTCVTVLRRELQTEPSEETRQLYRELVRRPAARESETARVAPGAASARSVRRSAQPGASGRGVSSREPALPAQAVAADDREPASHLNDPELHDTPLIGRQDEWARVLTALDAASVGRGQVVLVLGEAGIGKSRLIDELSAEARRRGARVLAGHAYESTQILPFGPWVDALRSGVVPLEEEEALAALPPVWRTQLARLLPELEVAAVPTATEDHLRLFESVMHLFELLTRSGPLVAVLEDMHWADEMSLRLLSFVGRRVSRCRGLVIASAREEELDTATTLRRAMAELGRERHVTRLTLPPLSRENTSVLVQALAGANQRGAASLEERVWAVSEGNPFVVVETVHAFEEGSLPPVSAFLPLPHRVQEVIAARFERLTERSVPLLEVGAVIGREFEFTLLQRAAAYTDREAAAGLEELVRRRLIHGMGEGFDFTHHRIREVALSQVLPPRRTVLHRQVGAALEQLYAANLDPHYAALGTHYFEGQMWEKAVVYLRQAAAQAAGRSAHGEAAACYEHAMAALERLPRNRTSLEQAVDLRLEARNSFLPLGRDRRIREVLAEAETSARALGDRPRLGRVLSFLCRDLMQISEHQRAIECGEQALEIAKGVEDVGLRAVSSFYLAIVYHLLGDFSRANELHHVALATLHGDLARERFGLPHLPAVNVREWLVRGLAELGDFGPAMDHGQAALDVAVAADQPWDLVIANLAAGVPPLLQGDTPRAIPFLERALMLCRRFEIPRHEPMATASLGHAYVLGGRIAEGLSLLEYAVAPARQVRSLLHVRLLSYLGEGYLLAGRLDEAWDVARRGLEFARVHSERGHEAWTTRLLGEVARAGVAAFGDAEVHYRQALAIASELGMQPLVAHCHLGLGMQLEGRRKRSDARAEFSAAIELYRAMKMDVWRDRAAAGLARTE